MSTSEQIEKAVQSLSGAELERFRAWFADFEHANQDVVLSRRAKLIQSSVKQAESGESRDGFQALDEMKQNISGRFHA